MPSFNPIPEIVFSRCCSAIGNTEPICPGCGIRLESIPARKTKCKACKQVLTARTRPLDEARVVVTPEQAEQTDRERHEVSRWKALCRLFESDTQYDIPAIASHEQWNKRPHAVLLQACAQQAEHHRAQRLWGLYRNDLFLEAEVLHHAEQSQRALSRYLEVCFLDANGPTNCSGLFRSGEFEPRHGYVNPDIVSSAVDIASRIALTDSALETEFRGAVERFLGIAKTPLSAKAAWGEFVRVREETRQRKR